MKQQQMPQQELTLSEKMKLVQHLALFPAITVMVFIRRRLGFRMLKPSRLIGMGVLLMCIDNIFSLFSHNGLGALFGEFPWVMMGFGFVQRFRRWRELCRGERWHTYSPGISYLEMLPLPRFLTTQRRLYRFVEPALLFILAMLVGIFFSEPLARWIAFSSICLFLYEQGQYEKQLERDLDVHDSLLSAEVHEEVVEHFEGGQPVERPLTLEETAGIPTGVSHDIRRQIEHRRAKLEREKEEDLVAA